MQFRACFTIRRVTCLFVAVFIAIPADAQEVLPDGTKRGIQQLATFKWPVGLKAELFAAEPQLSSPVAICLDEQGRVFVAEEYRFNRGTEENRTRPFLLEDDLQIKTLEDRLAMFRKHRGEFEGGMSWFTKVSDQVRLLEDRDNDGRADLSKVFAGNFNNTLDGLAAGVIARDGDIYLTNVPHLWRLRDRDGDGVAEIREPLLRGFGINAAFLGHDLHGLAWGPDGRLYFSVGDRGFNVQSKEGRQFAQPRRGAVFRCDPDGTNFEVLHIGLRNPQELAFDEYGNLFAADNNCDKGDLSRLVYIVPEGDSGWNMAYQTMLDPYMTGPWHAENMWRVEASGQPAWIIPPVGPLGAGPGGFAYYPGVGLGEQFDGHFFLCNHTSNGGVETFSIQSHGASFRIAAESDFLKPIRATDVDFGYDGKVYIADFGDLNWDGPSTGGRIYTVFDPQHIESPEAKEIRTLFSSGFRRMDPDRLLSLLAHPDSRVRLRAQFELARQASAASDRDLIEQLEDTAELDDARQSRHAIWALWQVSRQRPAAKVSLRELLTATNKVADLDRLQQLLRALGDLGDSATLPEFTHLLGHASPRIRFLSALAIGQCDTESDAKTVSAICGMLSANQANDSYIRHAGVNALAAQANDPMLRQLSVHPSSAVRMAALLVCRRRARDSAPCRLLLGAFLNSDDVELVTEAARAINGLALEGDPEAKLAAVAEHWGKWAEIPDALARRVIHASFRTRKPENLLECAIDKRLSLAMRREALECLKFWTTDVKRDRVNGNWRPLSGGPAQVIASRLSSGWKDRLLQDADGEQLSDVVQLLSQYRVQVDSQRFVDMAADAQAEVSTRIAAIQLLQQLGDSRLPTLAASFRASSEATLRIAGLEVLAATYPTRVAALLAEAHTQPNLTTRELQTVCRLLSKDKTKASDDILMQLIEKISVAEPRQPIAGAELDIVEAARVRQGNGKIQTLLRRYEQQLADLAAKDPVVSYRAALTGGDAASGAQLFRTHRLAQCVRCHSTKAGRVTAGPNLSGLGRRVDRHHILESILFPNAKIAQGFGQETIVTEDGRVIGGIVQKDGEGWLEVKSSNGKVERIAIAAIEERIAARSAMPELRDRIPLRTIRDLVEFLAQQRQ